MTDCELKAKKREWNQRWRRKHRQRILVKESLWREQHREQLRKRAKAWRLANPEKCKVWAKESYETKRDQLVEQKRTYNAKRRDIRIAKSKEYVAKYPEKERARRNNYRERNREILREKNRLYAKSNPGTVAAKTMRRIAARINATPLWANADAIKAFYTEAAEKSTGTGIKFVVDHIYPLQGRTVCGLHVEQNLRVITESENCHKSNRFPREEDFHVGSSAVMSRRR